MNSDLGISTLRKGNSFSCDERCFAIEICTIQLIEIDELSRIVGETIDRDASSSSITSVDNLSIR